MPSPRTAVFTVFLLLGTGMSSWATRLPALADQIGARESALGVAMSGTSAGMIAAAPLAARVCARVGARRATTLYAAGYCLALPALGLTRSVTELAAGLFVLGFLATSLGLTVNVAAVEVCRTLARPLMPAFHAGFSLGGLSGAGGAALAAAGGLPPAQHLLAVAVVGGALLAVVSRSLPGTAAPPARGGRRGSSGRPRSAAVSRGPLWLLGLIALCSRVGEGTVASWSALFLVQERGAGPAMGAAAYVGFSVTMIVARFLGGRAEARWGSLPLLRCGAGIAVTGLLVAALLPSAVAACAGFCLVGAGLAFSFPVVLGRAGALGRRPDGSGGEREIGFVTTVSNVGYLAVPPALGTLAEATSLGTALAAAAAAVAVIVPAATVAGRVTARGAPRRHGPTTTQHEDKRTRGEDPHAVPAPGRQRPGRQRDHLRKLGDPRVTGGGGGRARLRPRRSRLRHHLVRHR